MDERIAELLTLINEVSAHPNSFPYLPTIARSLEAMRDRIVSGDLDSAARRKMAGALGRLVTEDFAFSESSLGAQLLEFANDFASGEERSD